jgi:hypothetical protein
VAALRDYGGPNAFAIPGNHGERTMHASTIPCSYLRVVCRYGFLTAATKGCLAVCKVLPKFAGFQGVLWCFWLQGVAWLLFSWCGCMPEEEPGAVCC